MITSQILTLFLVITPLLGKGINYFESIFFYGTPLFFAIILFFKKKYSLVFPKIEAILVILFIISTIKSTSIGTSYYGLMIFITCLLILNISLNVLKEDNILFDKIVLASIFYSLVAIIYKFFIKGLFPSEFSDNVFVQNWGHSYIADFLVFSIPILIDRINPKNKYPTSLMLIIISLGIAISNSRSAQLALIIGLFFVKSDTQLKKIIKAVTLMIIIIFLGNTFFFANYLKSSDGSRPEYWTQAIKGFKQSPLFGNGPGTFNQTNLFFRNDNINTTNYAHSSLFENLSGNGIIFTTVFFIWIGTGLYHQWRHHRLIFILGLVALINSLLDPSWSSPGIFCLSLIFIFWDISTKKYPFWPILMTTIIFVFFITKTISDILFLQKNYPLSLKFDPFNPNSLIETLPNSRAKLKRYYAKDPGLLERLTDIRYLPENEKDFIEYIQLNPKGSTNQLVRLYYYYLVNQKWEKMEQLVKISQNQIDPKSSPFNITLMIAKSIYQLAIYQWSQGRTDDAITYLKLAVDYSHGWSQFSLELANAYWHSNQKDLAKKQVDACQQAVSSAVHCQQFKEKYANSPWPTPGYFRDVISQLSTP